MSPAAILALYLLVYDLEVPPIIPSKETRL